MYSCFNGENEQFEVDQSWGYPVFRQTLEFGEIHGTGEQSLKISWCDFMCEFLTDYVNIRLAGQSNTPTEKRMRYAGVSAGAILAGRTCDTAYWKGWDDPTVVPEESLEESLAAWQNL
jgi:hypothetical protein